MKDKLYFGGIVSLILLATTCVAMDGEPVPVASFSPEKSVSAKSQVSVSPSEDSGCQCNVSALGSQLKEYQREVEKLKSSSTTEAAKRLKVEQALLAETEERKRLEISLKTFELSLQTETDERKKYQQSEITKIARLRKEDADARGILRNRVIRLERLLRAETIRGNKLEVTLQTSLDGPRLNLLEIAVRNLKMSVLESPKKGRLMVAFSASVTGHLDKLQRKQTIVFGTVITNFGTGYNSTSGKFQCPISGLYQFSLSILSKVYEKSMSSVMKVNGITYLEVWAMASGVYTGSLGSNTVIKQLQKDDMVWEEVKDTAGIGDFIFCCYSTFTGHLIHDN